MSPRHEVTPAKKLEVLRLLAIDDYTLRDTANEVDLPYNVVADVAEAFGYPEPDRMLAAIDRLQDQADTPDSHIPAPRPVPAPPAPAKPAAAPAPATKPALESTGAAPVLALLERAKASKKARTRTAGEKIAALLEQLDATLRQEEAIEKNAARIAQLEAELAALKGKPATKGAGVDGGSDSKVIRAWAAENDVPCPAVGRVPTTVREAYEAAHDSDAA